VRIGQRYAAALAFAADLQAAPVPASVVDEGVDRIVARLRRYSPHIEPASGSPGVFWLDASGLERLYPRLEDWAEAIRADLDADTIVARVAVGTTRFGAYALARSARTGVVICADSAAERDAIEHVALGKLDFDPDVCRACTCSASRLSVIFCNCLAADSPRVSVRTWRPGIAARPAWTGRRSCPCRPAIRWIGRSISTRRSATSAG
jgi:hypothetical protein